MPTCSQCGINRAQYHVDSSVLCQPCLTLLDRAHNVSRLKRSRAPRVNLRAMHLFRMRIARGEFVGHLRTPSTLPAPPPVRRDSFLSRMRGSMRNLPNLFRGFFQPGRA